MHLPRRLLTFVVAEPWVMRYTAWLKCRHYIVEVLFCFVCLDTIGPAVSYCANTPHSATTTIDWSVTPTVQTYNGTPSPTVDESKEFIDIIITYIVSTLNRNASPFKLYSFTCSIQCFDLCKM